LRLTICLAAYNGEDYIREQIESITPQLEKGDEFLIADDGSTDKTLSIISEYKQYVSVVLEGRVGGVNKNYERLILASKNDGIVLVDQDDVWLPNRLNLVRNGLNSSYLVMTNGLVVDENLKSTGQSLFEYVGRRKGFIRNFYKNTYVGCCLAFRKELVRQALPFQNRLCAHDWLIGLLGEIDGRVADINESTILYRRHAKNASTTGCKSNNSYGKKIYIRLIMLSNLITILTLRSFNIQSNGSQSKL
jgi:glycosyltransferase involved in cell wall biosynthesis